MKILKSYKYNLKEISLTILIVFLTLSPLLSVGQSSKKYVVVLDAGHGGKDSGACKKHYIEKKIALNLVLKVGKELKKNKDIKVVYTRTRDVFVELHKRAAIANKNNADLFVSIHCNANNSSRPHGAETYVLGLNGNNKNLEISKKENAVILLEDNYKQNYDYDPNSPESVIGLSVLQEENLDASLAFADLVQKNFASINRFDRRVKQANFLVLRETVMPSVLVELGFLSNSREGRFLNSNSGQQKMAKALTRAIVRYVERLKKNTVYDVVNTTTNNNVNFKVQIASSRKKLLIKPYNFKGLTDVERVKVDKGYYKYYYGNTSDYKSIKEKLKKVRSVGYKDAFIVAFKDDERITVKEALKLMN
ncbi:MAG: N-acetylmuramoyl-L-alanine amidase [Tenacibaculum sp.]|nr:N-acetylmuramoyl-L-alanine amidase [Tenacibaculum sp.]